MFASIYGTYIKLLRIAYMNYICIYMSIQGGYVTTTYPKYKIDALNVYMNEIISLIVS